MAKIIGIDLGTTNSVVAVLEDGKARVLADASGEKLLPSVVGISAEGNLLVGKEAYNQYVINPDATVMSVKRKMGTDHQFHLNDKTFSPSEISAIILKKLKERAETVLKEPVDKAVITVPAYFSDAQRQATKQAGEMAGFEVLRIINEPTAAALVYNLQSSVPEKVLVYDLGGGTLDVSIVEISGGITEVLSSHGNNMLGGDDFDRKLQNLLVQEFEKKHKVDLRNDTRAMARLLRAAEKTKIQLSSYGFVDVKEEFLSKKGNEALHLSTTISRKDFDAQIESLLKSTLECVDQAMSDANLEAADLDRVILAGGSTRIPLLRDMLTAHLGKTLYDEIDPDLCVAMGAAYQAGILSGDQIDSILVDVTPYSLGVATIGLGPEGFMIPNLFSVIIPRNTVVPVSRSQIYSNPNDDMSRIEVAIYQGEQFLVDYNICLGEMWIEDLPPAPAHTLQIEVHFDFDVNGILTVTAQDRTSGKQQKLSISKNNSEISAPQLKNVQEKLEELWDRHFDSDEEDLDEEADEEADIPFSEAQQALYDRARLQLERIQDDAEANDLDDLLDEWIDAIQDQNESEINRLGEEIADVLYYLEGNT
ncbi:MAG: Hsp70 family protein [SAR324 cluster bacterium]|nr:Hsp70 family protein [SAR324 cluster bacterium]